MPSQAGTTPYVTFVGPEDNTIFLRDGQGNKIPCFKIEIPKHSKPNLRMFRIMPDGSQIPFAEASMSSLSGNVTISMQGQEAHVKITFNSFTLGYSLETPLGKMHWKTGGNWGEMLDLVDSQKTTVARYKTASLCGNDLNMDIFAKPIISSLK